MNKEYIRYYFHFLWAMTEKEIKARYKHTLFGFLWMILNPVFQMVVIGSIFSFFIRLPVDNYYLFLFIGLLSWQFFSLSLSKATPSFVHERYLLQKSKFPREAIPLSIIFSNFFHFIISLLLLVFYLLFTRSILFPQILYLVPASLLLLVFTMSISILSASLQVKYRDVNFFVQSFLILWFYATPIVYNLSLIPERLRVMYSLNPLSFVFELFHFSLIDQPFPYLNLFSSNFALIVLTAIASLFLYRKEQKFFVDWL